MERKKDIVIVGAGGMGREVQWYIERMNQKEAVWNFVGYIDNYQKVGTMVNGYPVLGGNEYLMKYPKELHVVIALGNSMLRNELATLYMANPNLYFPNIIDPSVIISERVHLGHGNILCPGCIVTVNITIGDFNIINWNTTIGHDVRIGSHVTLSPNVNVSGNVDIGDLCEVGTGTQIIEKKNIGTGTVLGAGSVVIRDIPAHTLAVGCPAKVIKNRV